MIIFTIVLALVVVVAAVAAAAASRRGAPATDPGAHRILDERVAAGSISEEEYRARAAVLSKRRVRAVSWTTIAVPVAVVAAVGLLVWAGGVSMAGGVWGDHDRLMGLHMGWSVEGGDAEEPVPGAAEVTVTATEMAFERATLQVAAGEPVNITLTNAGEVFHDLTVPELGFMLDAEPGQRVTGSLTVERPGAYEYLCSVPGHASAGMRGTLQVRTANN